MRKLNSFASMLLTIAMSTSITSCVQEETSNVPQDVTFTLDYTFVESGSMSRATGAEVYNDFYEKYIKAKVLTPSFYSLTFVNKETGAEATINGSWNSKDGIRLPEGDYEVTGTSVPREKDFLEWSDSVHLVFNETVSINRDDTKLTLNAIYDSFLLMFDAENTKSISCKTDRLTSSVKGDKLSKTDKLFWVFMQQPYYKDSQNDDYYLTISRIDGQKSTIMLIDIPFEKGKYYYFNDMTNSFDLPPMESGN